MSGARLNSTGSESALSLKSDDEGREARYGKSKTAAATNVNPLPFMRHDTTIIYASVVARQQSRIDVTIARIRGHLIARLTRTTPKTICLVGYHRSALSRPIRHARRLTTCRNRAHSMSLYQFSTYTSGKRVKKEGTKGGDVVRQERRRTRRIHTHTQTRVEGQQRSLLLLVQTTSKHRCRWNEASGVLDRRRRSREIETLRDDAGKKIMIINRR